MTDKEKIANIIKQKGACNPLVCSHCPIRFYRQARKCLLKTDAYQLAIEYYISHYGQEDLTELLI